MHRYGWLEKGRRAGIFKLLVEGRDPSSQDSPASSLPIPFCLALKDERFQLEEFSPRRVRIRLSDARLEDEGGYFCQLYTEDTHHQIATLTVLGNASPPQPQPPSPFSSASLLS